MAVSFLPRVYVNCGGSISGGSGGSWEPLDFWQQWLEMEPLKFLNFDSTRDHKNFQNHSIQNANEPAALYFYGHIEILH